MPSKGEWVCLCRRCNGVHSSTDAVQYVWEYALGSCSVPVVVRADVDPEGVVVCTSVSREGEPDEPPHRGEIGGLGEYIVSCRPGGGTAPTEGDVARWMQWESRSRHPIDWLLVDGIRFRSVAADVEALRQRSPLPDEEQIVGDWDRPPRDPSWQERIHRSWADSVD